MRVRSCEGGAASDVEAGEEGEAQRGVARRADSRGGRQARRNLVRERGHQLRRGRRLALALALAVPLREGSARAAAAAATATAAAAALLDARAERAKREGGAEGRGRARKREREREREGCEGCGVRREGGARAARTAALARRHPACSHPGKHAR